MDESNQKKPTEEMLAEARRLAFFADEVFSQDIMNSYEKTENYIQRHTQLLVEQKAIKPELERYFSSQEKINNKKKSHYSLAKQVLYYPVSIYVLLNFYLLSVDLNEWVFNIGQYNLLLLDWFPKAQYWVNISVVFREKMILLYVIFQFFKVYIILVALSAAILHWKKVKNNEDAIFFDAQSSMQVYRLYFCLGLFGLFFLEGVFGETGSTSFLMLEELDNSSSTWLLIDSATWNSITGFLIMKTIYVSAPGFGAFYGIAAVLSLMYSKKNNHY